MKRWQALLFLVAIAILPVAAFAGSKKETQNRVTIAGTTKGNVGCMILEKHMPLKKKLLFGGVMYARTEYRVLQSFHYKPARQKYTGTGEIKELNHEAVKDKIKLVIVPSNYSPDELTEAKKDCKEHAP
jgi:hypothetical protein